MFGISLGSLAEKVCDELGAPEQFGDAVSLGIDAYVGDTEACVEDTIDLASDDSPGADAPCPSPTGPGDDPYAQGPTAAPLSLQFCFDFRV